VSEPNSVAKVFKTLKETLVEPGPVIPVVRLEGVIASGGRGNPISLHRVEKTLAKAFGDAGAPCVVIQVNSPGGSPVQSRLIHDRIRALAVEKDKRVIVHCEDVAASGGYMIAAAGDEIWCDPATITGSIGVINMGFGLTGLMGKLGIERRVHAAGRNKVLADPFAPETEEQKARFERITAKVHEQFIALIKARRGDRLSDDPELFTGEVYLGEEAAANGLVDKVCDLRAELKARHGETTRLKPLIPPKGGPLARFMGSAVTAAADELEARSLWAAYGR
jgi:signal peptide peptidase SppA